MFFFTYFCLFVFYFFFFFFNDTATTEIYTLSLHDALPIFLTQSEVADLQREAGSFPPPPATVPPFVRNLLTFPYPTGEAFVQALQSSGGEGRVNEAFEHPPLSTEQVLHPSK